jgi:Na+-driven multidrug efflux pump
MEWGLLIGLVAGLALFLGRSDLASLFSNDESVVESAAWLLAWLAAVQPLSALAFTLDGILIGASDTRFLAQSMLLSSVGFAGVSVASLNLDWGIEGLATGATLWLVLRTATTAWRWRGEQWMLAA